MATLSEQVTSITRDTIVRNLFDQVNVNSPFLLMMLGKATAWTSGTDYKLPVKISKSTQGGAINPVDRLDSARENNRKQMQFQPKMMQKPVVVGSLEVTLNAGDEQILELITTEMDSQQTDLMDDFADELYTGTGADPDWDSIIGAADDGTNFATYGNLSRTTFPALDGFLNTSVGSLTLAILATTVDSVKNGTNNPTGIFTTEALWSVYEALLTPTVRANYSTGGFPQMTVNGIVAGSSALGGTAGFDSISFRGIPMMSDEKCTSGNMFFVNQRKNGKFPNFGYAAITLKGAEFETVNFKNTSGKPQGTFGSSLAPRGFSFRDLMNPTDQLASVGHLLFSGNFLAASPRSQGRLTGVTA